MFEGKWMGNWKSHQRGCYYTLLMACGFLQQGYKYHTHRYTRYACMPRMLFPIAVSPGVKRFLLVAITHWIGTRQYGLCRTQLSHSKSSYEIYL